MSFIGNYSSSIKKNGTVELPKKVAQMLYENGVSELVMFLSDENTKKYIMCVPDSYDINKFQHGETYAVQITGNKLKIPEELVKGAGLEGKITFAGVVDTIEIWSGQKLNLNKINKKSLNKIRL